MIISSSTAETLAKRLLSENRSGRPWREIACEDYGNRVHYATLCRIAKSGGTWVPKKRKVLIVLGLAEPKRRTNIEKAITRMAKQTNKDVLIVKKKEG